MKPQSPTKQKSGTDFFFFEPTEFEISTIRQNTYLNVIVNNEIEKHRANFSEMVRLVCLMQNDSSPTLKGKRLSEKKEVGGLFNNFFGAKSVV